MAKAKRRLNGEGTEIVEIVVNGTKYYMWQISYKDASGKTQRKTIKRKIKADVVYAKKVFLKEIEKLKNISSPVGGEKITIEEWLDQWMELFKTPPAVKRSTQRDYANKIKSYINPTIGSIELKKLTTIDLQNLINELNKTLSGSSVCDIFKILKSALIKAVELKYIYEIPTGYELPSNKNKEMHILTDAHFEAIKKTKSRFQLLYMLYAYLGLRRNEGLAISWENVNLEQKTIQIEKNLNLDMDLEEKFYLDDPKTYNSNRTVYLSNELVDLLQTHKKQQEATRKEKGKYWNPYNFVFCTTYGGFIYPQSVWESWRLVLKKFNLPYVRLHDMRHTFCTNALEAGANVATVMKVAGHAKLQTLQRYLHPTAEAQKNAFDLIAKTHQTREE